MFIFKTHIKQSGIHGIGVFASEFIPKGKIIWKFQEGFDIKITQSQYNELPIIAKEHFNFFGYFNEKEGGWVLCTDNAKYTNHSSTPNMRMLDTVDSISTRDIKEGEEITEDYFVFDEKASEKNLG